MIAPLRSARMRASARALRPRRLSSWIGLSLVGLALAACQSDGGESDDAAAAEGAGESAGTTVSGAPPVDPARQMAMMSELQSIETRLTPIRERAMQSPELQAKEQALVAQVQAAMNEIYPEMETAEARFDSLVAEFEAARAAEDTARAQTLGGEIQGLQMSFNQVQMEALQQEDVAEALEAFRSDLFEAMRGLDATADSLLDRAEELNDDLEAAAGG